jgi:hypothetical protein
VAHLHDRGCRDAVDVMDWDAEEDFEPLLHRLSAGVQILGSVGARVSGNGRVAEQRGFRDGDFGGVQMELDGGCGGGQMSDIGNQSLSG